MSITTSTSVSSASSGTIPPRDYVVVVASSGGDYTTLASAVADAGLVSNGGTIMIREGTYSISATVTLPNSNVTIRGAGVGNTIISVGANAIAAFSIANANNYTFEDFTISGTTGTNHKGFAVTADVLAIVRISRVRLLNIKTGITTVYASNLPEFHVNNCNWDLDNVAAALIASGGVWMRCVDCQMQSTGSYGGFASATASRIHMTHCTLSIDNNGSGSTIDHGSLVNCTVYGQGTFTFGGNPIARIVGSFFSTGTHLSVNGPGTSVVGNMFNGGLITVTGIGISVIGNSYIGASGYLGIKSTAQNVTIAGNNLQNNGTAAYGVYLIDIGSAAHACIITGNDINGHGSGNALLNIASAIKCVVTGNRFNPDSAVGTIIETGTTNNTWVTGNFGTDAQNGVTLVGLASVYEGTANPGTTGTTTDAYVTLFTHTNPKGLGFEIGSLKNTHASNGLTVEEQVIDFYGTTETQETAVVALKNVLLDPYRARAFTTVLPPWKQYRIRVKSTSAGNAATYSYQDAARGAQS